MKSAALWSAVFLLCLLLQSTLGPQLAYHGVHADLVLIAVVSSSLLLGKERGALHGFCAGFLQDLLSGGFLGLNALTKTLWGYVFGMAEQKVFKDHVFLPVMSMLVATAGDYLLKALMLALLGQRFNLLVHMAYVFLPLLLYNLLFSLPVYKAMCLVGRWTKEWEERRL